MLTSDAPVDAGSSPDAGPSQRRTRTRAPWVMATVVMVLGCRPSGVANQAPNDAGTAQTPADPRSSVSDEPVGEAERNTRAERYLSEERWNTEASNDDPKPPRTDGRHPLAPTQAELDAWERKNPENTHLHVYEWDALNFGRMEGYFHDLECFHAFMVAAGEAGRGAAPGTKVAKAWADAKRQLMGELDAWLKQLFTNEPRILEHSKFVVRFLEAHEVITRVLPAAYDDGDQLAIDEAEAQWMTVVARFDEYARAVGKVASRAGDAHCKAMRRP